MHPSFPNLPRAGGRLRSFDSRAILASGLSCFALALGSVSRLAAAPATGGEFALVGEIVSGGGSAAGGSFALESTIGLPTAGVSTGGTFVLSGGLIGVYVVPGDLEVHLARTDDGQARLSWPDHAEGYVLEFTLRLGSDAVWTPVTPSPTANFLSLPFDQPARFYRLRKR